MTQYFSEKGNVVNSINFEIPFYNPELGNQFWLHVPFVLNDSQVHYKLIREIYNLFEEKENESGSIKNHIYKIYKKYLNKFEIDFKKPSEHDEEDDEAEINDV